MEKEEQIKWAEKIRLVYCEIQKYCDKGFRFPRGAAGRKQLAEFVMLFQNKYGSITNERIVDYCIYTAYAFRGRTVTVKQLFSKPALTRFAKKLPGSVYYEDKWLYSKTLTRDYLMNFAKDRQEHPQQKYLYVPSEEASKSRMLNQQIGFYLCQSSTLGWSPLSPVCGKCNFVDECKNETQKKYPELFRLREEYGKNKQCTD